MKRTDVLLKTKSSGDKVTPPSIFLLFFSASTHVSLPPEQRNLSPEHLGYFTASRSAAGGTFVRLKNAAGVYTRRCLEEFQRSLIDPLSPLDGPNDCTET